MLVCCKVAAHAMHAARNCQNIISDIHISQLPMALPPSTSPPSEYAADATMYFFTQIAPELISGHQNCIY